jgi:hypothetical protein
MIYREALAHSFEHLIPLPANAFPHSQHIRGTNRAVFERALRWHRQAATTRATKCRQRARWCANRPAVVFPPSRFASQRIRAETGTPRPCHPIDRLLSRSVDWAESVREDDGLVAKHRRLSQTPTIIARASLPAHVSMFCNGLEMFVTLRDGGLICNGCDSRWEQ